MNHKSDSVAIYKVSPGNPY